MEDENIPPAHQSLSDTVFKPRGQKRPFHSPNFHENTLAAEFAGACTSQSDSSICQTRPCNLPRAKDYNLSFNGSQFVDSSIVSVCSFRKKSCNVLKERITNVNLPNFDFDQSYNQSISQSNDTLVPQKPHFKFDVPSDLTFGVSSSEPSSKESSQLSSDYLSSSKQTDSEISIDGDSTKPEIDNESQNSYEAIENPGNDSSSQVLSETGSVLEIDSSSKSKSQNTSRSSLHSSEFKNYDGTMTPPLVNNLSGVSGVFENVSLNSNRNTCEFQESILLSKPEQSSIEKELPSPRRESGRLSPRETTQTEVLLSNHETPTNNISSLNTNVESKQWESGVDMLEEVSVHLSELRNDNGTMNSSSVNNMSGEFENVSLNSNRDTCEFQESILLSKPEQSSIEKELPSPRRESGRLSHRETIHAEVLQVVSNNKIPTNDSSLLKTDEESNQLKSEVDIVEEVLNQEKLHLSESKNHNDTIIASVDNMSGVREEVSLGSNRDTCDSPKSIFLSKLEQNTLENECSSPRRESGRLSYRETIQTEVLRVVSNYDIPMNNTSSLKTNVESKQWESEMDIVEEEKLHLSESTNHNDTMTALVNNMSGVREEMSLSSNRDTCESPKSIFLSKQEQNTLENECPSPRRESSHLLHRETIQTEELQVVSNSETPTNNTYSLKTNVESKQWESSSGMLEEVWVHLSELRNANGTMNSSSVNNMSGVIETVSLSSNRDICESQEGKFLSKSEQDSLEKELPRRKSDRLSNKETIHAEVPVFNHVIPTNNASLLKTNVDWKQSKSSIDMLEEVLDDEMLQLSESRNHNDTMTPLVNNVSGVFENVSLSSNRDDCESQKSILFSKAEQNSPEKELPRRKSDRLSNKETIHVEVLVSNHEIPTNNTSSLKTNVESKQGKSSIDMLEEVLDQEKLNLSESRNHNDTMTPSVNNVSGVNGVFENVSPNSNCVTSEAQKSIFLSKPEQNILEKECPSPRRKSGRLSNRETIQAEVLLSNHEIPTHNISSLKTHVESKQWESGIDILEEIAETEMTPQRSTQVKCQELFPKTNSSSLSKERESKRLSKRKSSDNDAQTESAKNYGSRRSARLSTKSRFSVRFVDTFHSISTIEGPSASPVSVIEKSCPSQKSLASSRTASRTGSKNSSEPSLINKLFAQKDDSVFVQPTSAAPKRKKKSAQLLPFTEDDEIAALPKNPIFPRLADYIHSRFYNFLIEKMEPRYGIQTNAKAVQLAEYIHAKVEKISWSKEQYPEEEVEELKLVLARKQIVQTPYEFWYYCWQTFPHYFMRKAFPLFVYKNGERKLRDCSGYHEPILSSEENEN